MKPTATLQGAPVNVLWQRGKPCERLRVLSVHARRHLDEVTPFQPLKKRALTSPAGGCPLRSVGAG